MKDKLKKILREYKTNKLEIETANHQLVGLEELLSRNDLRELELNPASPPDLGVRVTTSKISKPVENALFQKNARLTPEFIREEIQSIYNKIQYTLEEIELIDIALKSLDELEISIINKAFNMGLNNSKKEYISDRTFYRYLNNILQKLLESTIIKKVLEMRGTYER